MPRYHSPLAQVLVVSCACFLAPGMFNALNGLGGAGQLDPRTSNNANTAVYLAFALSSFAGGGIVNILGIRYPAAVACLTYALYTGSYCYYNTTGDGAFTIVAGAVMGVGAGVLWTAQGVVMVSYPSERDKGKFISIFWVIFNLGGLIGGILPFAINFYNSGSLTNSVYMLFVIIECGGAVAALFLVPPTSVVRNDGSHPTLFPSNGARQECAEVLRLFRNKWMLLLLPMSFASNFFYGYQFSLYNGALFTPRTRGLNNLLYWASQMLGSILLFVLLDFVRWTRRKRGTCALALMALAFNAVWAGTVVVQRRYTRGGEHTDYPGGIIDFMESSRSAGPIALYFFMGMADAWFQNIAYWIIGALTSDSYRTARLVGFYKGIQSLGAAVSWQLAARELPYMHQLIGNWFLFAVSLPAMFYTIAHLEEHALDDQVICLSPRTAKSHFTSAHLSMDVLIRSTQELPRKSARNVESII
ncbi:hypothetical protein LPJ61_005596 [Coemansia biformis]|uniref:MFS general substrate transporter n=1 Tax=Coemansia biformis TaxID=1286918 RepID=A0A9W7Y734_9FUNG|nr:hypothetical protein LPJ61_005596 [Coemansia biformis]